MVTYSLRLEHGGRRRCPGTRGRLWRESSSLPDTAAHFNTAHAHSQDTLRNQEMLTVAQEYVLVQLTAVWLMEAAEALLLRNG